MRHRIHIKINFIFILCLSFLILNEPYLFAKADILPEGLLGINDITEGDFTYRIRPEEKTAVLTAYHGGSEAVVPSTLGGYTIDTISDDAFYDLTRGSSLTLPPAINHIGAFKVKNEDLSNFKVYVVENSSAETIVLKLELNYDYYNFQGNTSDENPSSDGNSSGYGSSTSESITQVNPILKLPSEYNGDGFYGELVFCKECGIQHVEASYTNESDISQISLSSAYSYVIRHYYDTPKANGDTYFTQRMFGFPKSSEILDSLNKQYPVLSVHDFHAPAVQSISLPDCIVHIEEDCFKACMKLTSFSLPPLVTEIKNGTFSYCTSLSYINLGRACSIGDNAFWACESLTTIELPSALTKIGDNAFVGCDSLKSVVIPRTVTEIGKNAFGYDTNDSGIPGYGTYVQSSEKTAVTDFIIYGYIGTEAEAYCERNDFIKFIALDEKDGSDEWTVVIDEINDRYASGETVISIPLSSNDTLIPARVFETIKDKENLTVDFLLDSVLSFSIQGKNIVEAQDTELTASLLEAPDILGKGIKVEGAEKVYYLILPPAGFGYSETLNLDFGDTYDINTSFEFMFLNEDGTSLINVPDISFSTINNNSRRIYERSILPDTQYYVIIHRNGFSTSFTEHSESETTPSPVVTGSSLPEGSYSDSTPEEKESSDSSQIKTAAIIASAVVLTAGAGIGTVLIKKHRIQSK